ncbi:MAG: Hint domain-containing protein [bacterium]|nr:Hint domain-containing protein [bacterium]
MNLEKTKNNHDKGYTLVELMAVLIIIGILTTLIVASIGRYKERASEEYINSLEDQMELAAKSYYSDHPEELPRGQIVGDEKINSTKIMASTLADAGYFTNELVDEQGNSCEEKSYAITNNINNKISYDVCLICNGKVLNESAYCKLLGFEPVNSTPYCSLSSSEQNHMKKLTIYTNKNGTVTSDQGVNPATDGSYYVYKPGYYTFKFTTKDEDGNEEYATCGIPVYFEEDKKDPTCTASCNCDNNSCSCYANWEDEVSLASVTDSTGRTIQNYSCKNGEDITKDNNSPLNSSNVQTTITKTTSSQTYTVTVTDCSGNTNTCSTTIPAKTTTPSTPQGGSDTCVGSSCNTCDCEGYDVDECTYCYCTSSCRLRCRTISGCSTTPDPEPSNPTTPTIPTTPTKPPVVEEENPNTGCFLNGTKIHTKNGLKNIEDIKVGDYVLSYNEETKQTEYNRVYDTYIHTKNNEELYELTINGKILKVTAAHRFYVKEKGTTEFVWEEAKGLKVGDILLDSNNKEQKITNINHYIHFGTVYNFAVENNHNYYVTENGYLVHNKPSLGGGSCSGTSISNPNASLCN